MSNTARNKKRRVRYDRVAVALIIIILLFALIIWIISSIISGIAGLFSSTPNDNSSSLPVSSSVSDSKTDTLSPTFSTTEYSQVFKTYNDIHNGFLILVNNDNEYVFPTDESRMSSLYDNKTAHYKVKDNTLLLDNNVIKSFNSMMSGFYAAQTNNDILVSAAYYTAAHQNILYNQALDNNIVIPKGGFSEHHTGFSVDLDISPENDIPFTYKPEGIYAWINDNCDKYGFTLRYPAEKANITKDKGDTAHFRYVGIPHAYYMKAHNLCLEEYIDELKNYVFGTNSLKISCYSKEYEVYYIKAKKDTNTEVFVPINNNYVVSGNNIDGFIVTCEIK